MMSAAEKKVFYNRVRRTCKLYDIDIVYEGVPKAYRSVCLVKDGYTMFADRAPDWRPLNIDWKRLHEEMTDYGFTGGIK